MTKSWETALISGGGSGIGLRLAEEFLGMGARVALVDLAFNEDARARLSRATGGKPDARCWTFDADVRNAERMLTVARDAAAALGRIDIAINSAGVLYAAEFEKISEEQFRRVVEINLFGSRNFAGTVDIDVAMREILAGLRARTFVIIPGGKARLTRRLAGMVPGLLQRITDGIVRKTLHV